MGSPRYAGSGVDHLRLPHQRCLLNERWNSKNLKEAQLLLTQALYAMALGIAHGT